MNINTGFRRLVSFHLLWYLLCSLLSTSFAAEYRLKNYDYPRIKGASWMYYFDPYPGDGFSPSEPSTELARITLTDTNWPLDMTRGRSHPEGYLKNTCRFEEEDGYWYDGDFRRAKRYIYERSSFYRGVKAGGAYHFGTDKLSAKGDPGRVEPQERLDGGLRLPPVMRVGERIRATADYYENGMYYGVVQYSVTLVSHCSVKVPYGVFNDCLRLRFVIRVDGDITPADEWWAKGVGMVKSVARGEVRSIYALEGFRLKGDRPAVMRDIEVTHPDQEPEPYSPEYLFIVRLPVVEDTVPFVHTELTIRNKGDTVLSEITAKLRPPAEGYSIVSKPLPSRLRPGESATIKLELRPAMVYRSPDSLGISRTGCEIDIHSNDPDHPDILVGVSVPVHHGD